MQGCITCGQHAVMFCIPGCRATACIMQGRQCALTWHGLRCMQAVQQAFFAELFEDVLGFAGAVIIRRILGIAHVIDFESIADADIRCV